jgi:Xaa-Pro aminopeptidase
LDKIIKLKNLLKKYKLDGYFVPMADEFFCEYVPEQSRRLEFLTGFTGSAGSCLVGLKNSIFETDGRYELQAQSQVGSLFDKILITPKNNLINWLEQNINTKSVFKIGFDAKLISQKQLEKFENIANKNIKFVAISQNLVDEVWQTKPHQKPIEKLNQAFAIDTKIAGKTHIQKIAEMSESLQAEYCLLTLPESVCWLLNIRGRDLPHTPFLLGYGLINKKNKSVILYTNTKKISAGLSKKLGKNVELKNLEEMERDLKKLKNKSVQICPSNTSAYFYNLLQKSNVKIIHAADPCLLPKACKNTTEINGIRQAHIIDGVALCKFFYWLNNNIKTKKLDELNIADKLEEIRKNNKDFFSLSFDTIAGFGANGAIIHYRADKNSNKKISGNNLLLLDSGAQYFGANNTGTTDVTRTIAIGKPSTEQKRNFTLVLKGHIALANAKFIKGTNGSQLDVLARKFLWAEDKDYAHGTGHGVGHFFNVHEGPQGISKYNQTPLQAGMVISNEPGFYKAGEYGIRIENLVVVKQSKNDNFLEFETLTKAPIDLSLIDIAILDKSEKTWLNNYHAQIAKEIMPLLNKNEKAWLKNATKKIL